MTFIPVPGTSVSFCTLRATIPGVRVQHFLYLSGTSVSFLYARATIPGICVSSATLPYPYPESANPTERNLANLQWLMSFFIRFLAGPDVYSYEIYTRVVYLAYYYGIIFHRY